MGRPGLGPIRLRYQMESTPRDSIATSAIYRGGPGQCAMITLSLCAEDAAIMKGLIGKVD